MKKIYNLFWTLALLCGLTVTSCMDYEEPEGISALRTATAELISAQAAVTNAEVAIQNAIAAQEEAIAAGLLIENQLAEINVQIAAINLAIAELELAERTAESEYIIAGYQADIDALEREQELALTEHEAALLDAQADLLAAQEDYEKALSDLVITLSGIDTDQAAELQVIIDAISDNRTDYYAAQCDLIDLNLDLLKTGTYTYDQTTYTAQLEWDIENQEYVIASYENVIANYEAYNGVSATDPTSLATIKADLDELIAAYNTYFAAYDDLADRIALAVASETDLSDEHSAAEKALSDEQSEAEQALSDEQSEEEQALSDEHSEAETALSDEHSEAETALSTAAEEARIASYTVPVSNSFAISSTNEAVINTIINALYTEIGSDIYEYGLEFVYDTPAGSGINTASLKDNTFVITSDDEVTSDNLAAANTTLQTDKIYSFNKAIRDIYAQSTSANGSSTSLSDEELEALYDELVANGGIVSSSNETIAQTAIAKAAYESAQAAYTSAESTFITAYEDYKWGTGTMYDWITGQIAAYNAVRESYRTEEMQIQLAADIATYAKLRQAVDGFAAVRTNVSALLVTTYEYWYTALERTEGWNELFDITPAVYDPQNSSILISAAVVEKTLNTTSGLYLDIIGSASLLYSSATGPADIVDGAFDITSSDKTYSEYPYGAYCTAYEALYGINIAASPTNPITYATAPTFEEVCAEVATTPAYLSGSVIATYATLYNATTAINVSDDQIELATELKNLYALTASAYLEIKAAYDVLAETATTDAEALTTLQTENAEALSTLQTENAEALTTLQTENAEALTTLQTENAEALTALQESNAAALEAMQNDTEGSVTLTAAQALITIFIDTPSGEIYIKSSTTTASNDISKIELNTTISSSNGTLCLEINQLVNIYNDIVSTANAVNYDKEILTAKETLIDEQAELAELNMELEFILAGGYEDSGEYLATAIAKIEADILLKEAEIEDLDEIYDMLVAQKDAFLAAI